MLVQVFPVSVPNSSGGFFFPYTTIPYNSRLIKLHVDTEIIIRTSF